ncbi:MAG: endonuclease/exonuclease/phosphatase family protein [Pseudomonadota bacterium]
MIIFGRILCWPFAFAGALMLLLAQFFGAAYPGAVFLGAAPQLALVAVVIAAVAILFRVSATASVVSMIAAGFVALSIKPGPLADTIVAKEIPANKIPANGNKADVITADKGAPGQSAEASPQQSDVVVIWSNVAAKEASVKETIQLAYDRQADLVVIGEYPMSKLGSGDYMGYPYVAGRSADGSSAIAVFSKHPILSPAPIVSEETWGRQPLAFSVEIDGRLLSVGAAHPLTPLSSRGLRHREGHLRAVFDRAKTATETRRLIVGDFNMPAWDPQLHDMAAKAKMARISLGGQATWRSKSRLFGLPIDHAFIDNTGEANLEIGPDTGSDHFPLIVTLSMAE